MVLQYKPSKCIGRYVHRYLWMYVCTYLDTLSMADKCFRIVREDGGDSVADLEFVEEGFQIERLIPGLLLSANKVVIIQSFFFLAMVYSELVLL